MRWPGRASSALDMCGTSRAWIGHSGFLGGRGQDHAVAVQVDGSRLHPRVTTSRVTTPQPPTASHRNTDVLEQSPVHRGWSRSSMARLGLVSPRKDASTAFSGSWGSSVQPCRYGVTVPQAGARISIRVCFPPRSSASSAGDTYEELDAVGETPMRSRYSQVSPHISWTDS